MPTSTETASVAALHEAGHLVAAALRGGEAIYAWVSTDGEGFTGFRGVTGVTDQAFVTYAGPYAESRHPDSWSSWPDEILDGQRDEGSDFAELCALHGGWDAVDEHAAAWERELDRVWPVIQHVAEQLERGGVIAPFAEQWLHPLLTPTSMQRSTSMTKPNYSDRIMRHHDALNGGQ